MEQLAKGWAFALAVSKERANLGKQNYVAQRTIWGLLRARTLARLPAESGITLGRFTSESFLIMTTIKKTLKAIDEVANLIPAIEALYDDDGNIVADREPEYWYWVNKVTGAKVVPNVILPCVHAWEGDAENVRRGLAACWALGVPARDALAVWGRHGWKQVSCVVVTA